MIKKILALWAASLLLAACGAAPITEEEAAEFHEQAEEPFSDLGLEPHDYVVASMVQALTAHATPTLSYGVRNTADKSNCDRTSAGQDCRVPRTKAIRWCVTNGLITVGDPFSTTDEVRVPKVSAIMSSAINSAMAKFGWSITHVADDSNGSPDACFNGTRNVTVSLVSGTSGLCGSATGANVENYACVNLSGVIGPLTESLPGTYKSFDGSVILVDYEDILAKGVQSVNVDALLYHSLGHSMLVTVGIGAQTAQSNLLSRRAVLPFATNPSAPLGTSSSENCRALGYNVSSPSAFALHATLGCPN